MPFRPRLFGFLLFCLGLSSSYLTAQTTFNWTNSGGGSYHTAGNWSPAGGPPLFDDFARFNLNSTYGVTFANNGTQTIDFQVRQGTVTFSYLNSTAKHFWGSTSTNYVGPLAGDAASSATLNLINMANNPMQGNDLMVGHAAGKTGTLNVLTNGHWLGYANSNVTVGSAGTGNLNISTSGLLQKSTVEAYNVSLGTSGGTGTGNVSGFNAKLIANNVLTVGAGANSLGTLNISNQGQVVVNDSLFIGANSSQNNKVTVSGSGSSLILGNDSFQVGYGGKGTLRLENGGTLTNNSSAMVFGGPAGGVGILEVAGPNAHFLSTGTQTLTGGDEGVGQLSVTNGGLLEVSQLKLANSAGSSGSLLVDGTGSLVNLHGVNANMIGDQGTAQITVSNNGVLSTNGGLNIGNFGLGSLSVQTGGQVYSQNGSIGGQVGAAGSSVSVSGTGSLWSATNGIDVAWKQSAELNISNGGQVSSNGGRLGILADSQGTANLAGPGSQWNTTGSSTFVVGQAGQGTLNVASGAQVISDQVAFGTVAGGSGLATISGAGSQWTINKSLFLGDVGQGTLNVSNGGKVISGATSNFRVGYDALSTGKLSVSGTGSQMNLAPGASLSVGAFGTGDLQVTSGGKILGGKGTLGVAASAQGTALVRHALSQWQLNDELIVGANGEGRLNVENGGQVSALNLQVAQSAGSTGDVTLSGTNTNLTTTGQMALGGSLAAEGGSGTLNLLGGATASVGSQLTLWSQGHLMLNGGKLVLNALDGQGGKVTWNNGTVEFRNNTVLNEPVLDTLLGTSHTLGNFQTLTTGPTGGLVIAPGHFTVDGGKVTGNHFTNIGTTSVLRGSLQMNGNFLNDVQGTFVVGGTGQVAFGGTLQNNGLWVLDGVAAKSSGGLLTNQGTLVGTGRLNHQVINQGFLEVNSGDQLTIANGTNLSTNSGMVQLADGRLNVTGQFANEMGGLITGHGVLATSTLAPGSLGLINRGQIAVGGDNLDVHGDVRNLNGGRILTSGQGTTTFWDDVEHNGAEIRTALGSSTVFYGTVSGAGPFTGAGAVFMEGDLKPGNSPASVLFEGDLNFGSTAALNLELGGLTAGSEFDQLTVLGNVVLNGSLSVSLINGYTPNSGDSFLLIDNRGPNALFGQFDGLADGDYLFAGGHKFVVDYQGGGNGRGLALLAVPEPSAPLALTLTLFSLAFCRSRKLRNHSPISQDGRRR